MWMMERVGEITGGASLLCPVARLRARVSRPLGLGTNAPAAAAGVQKEESKSNRRGGDGECMRTDT
jgi:hypothetical protein